MTPVYNTGHPYANVEPLKGVFQILGEFQMSF